MRMTRRILLSFIALFSCTVLFTTVSYSQETEPAHTISTKIVEDILDREGSALDQYTDIRDALEEMPEMAALIQNKNAIETLRQMQNTENTTELDRYVNILINYLESDCDITDLVELQSYVTIYLTTRSGNSILARRHSYSNEILNYNCHSYAWYYGCNYNSSDRIWIEAPSPYYTTTNGTCYTRLYNSPVLPSSIIPDDSLVGCIVVYKRYSDENSPYPDAHSGTIVSVENSMILVKSKHGSGSITTDLITQVSECIAEGGSHDGQMREVQIYSRGPDIDSTWLANQNYRYMNSTGHYIACAFCARHTVGSEAHSFTTAGSIKTCTKCGYRVVLQNGLPGETQESPIDASPEGGAQ